MLTGNTLLDICEWALNGLRIYLILQPHTARKMSQYSLVRLKCELVLGPLQSFVWMWRNLIAAAKYVFSRIQVIINNYFKSCKRPLKIPLRAIIFLWANSNSSLVQVFISFMRNALHLTNYFFWNRFNGKTFIILYYQISLFYIYLLYISFSHYIILSPRARVYWY